MEATDLTPGLGRTILQSEPGRLAWGRFGMPAHHGELRGPTLVLGGLREEAASQPLLVNTIREANMAATFSLLDARQFTAATEQEGWLIADVSEYVRLVISFRVISSGSGGSLVIQTAAIDTTDDTAWADIANAPLDTAGSTVAEVTAFSKFIRWSVQNPSGSPVAEVRVVAKRA